jgi:hypothetical protein
MEDLSSSKSAVPGPKPKKPKATTSPASFVYVVEKDMLLVAVLKYVSSYKVFCLVVYREE